MYLPNLGQATITDFCNPKTLLNLSSLARVTMSIPSPPMSLSPGVYIVFLTLYPGKIDLNLVAYSEKSSGVDILPSSNKSPINYYVKYLKC